MEGRIHGVRFRGILESRGQMTVEAQVQLADGGLGVGSSPVAIAPGRRERTSSRVARLGPLGEVAEFGRLERDLQGACFESQAEFDDWLDAAPAAATLGATVTLPLSVAFCRACAASRGISLLRWLSMLTGVPPAMPRPLVNIFSGGIHDPSGANPFQNIMLLCQGDGIVDNISLALRVYGEIERRLRQRGESLQYSASSGLVRTGIDYQTLLDDLQAVLATIETGAATGRIGIDVAAEHLRTLEGRYRLGADELDGNGLLERLKHLVESCDIGFLEDPFDADDTSLWRALVRDLKPSTCIVGDDLFATNRDYIAPGLATGIVLKLSQIGTVTGVCRAAHQARSAKLTLCVSHRSGETEDTVVCDLAVAIGATYIKVGGPRRGDRIAKYNQLLRLAETLATG